MLRKLKSFAKALGAARYELLTLSVEDVWLLTVAGIMTQNDPDLAECRLTLDVTLNRVSSVQGQLLSLNVPDDAAPLPLFFTADQAEALRAMLLSYQCICVDNLMHARRIKNGWKYLETAERARVISQQLSAMFSK